MRRIRPRKKPKPYTEQELEVLYRTSNLIRFLILRFPDKPTAENLIEILEDTAKSLRQEFFPAEAEQKELFPEAPLEV